jgi:hypothetical protein
MIRPWYRSRLFWLGLPGLVFMLWLWLAKGDQSFAFGHIAITGPGEETLRIIGTYDGSIHQRTTRYHKGTSTGWQRGFHWRGFHRSETGLAPEHINYFPSGFEISRRAQWGREHREIRLAWWVVISAYTPVWLGTVAGWQRRKARLSRQAAAEMPGS